MMSGRVSRRSPSRRGTRTTMCARGVTVAAGACDAVLRCAGHCAVLWLVWALTDAAAGDRTEVHRPLHRMRNRLHRPV